MHPAEIGTYHHTVVGSKPVFVCLLAIFLGFGFRDVEVASYIPTKSLAHTFPLRDTDTPIPPPASRLALPAVSDLSSSLQPSLLRRGYSYIRNAAHFWFPRRELLRGVVCYGSACRRYTCA
jgi:hypothetical protein